MIEIKDIHKRYNDLEVLKGISVSIDKGEVISIIGPSGTGKSTFLRCINYLEVAEQGTISFGNETYNLNNMSKKEVNQLRSHSSMVFQNWNLFKNRTALENIMEHLIYVKKLSKDKSEEIAKKYLEVVGLSEKKDYYPHQLSGGQQQRIGIARAIIMGVIRKL